MNIYEKKILTARQFILDREYEKAYQELYLDGNERISDTPTLSAVPSEEYESLKDEYDRAVKEIGMLQDELKDANNEIRDLEYQIRQG